MATFRTEKSSCLNTWSSTCRLAYHRFAFIRRVRNTLETAFSNTETSRQGGFNDIVMSTLHNLPTLNLLIRFSALMGFVLSLYTYIVEINLHYNHDYVAMCDISDHMSCSKAFTSQWGTGFGFVGQLLGDDSIFNQPNSVPGMVFYVIVFLLSFPDRIAFAKVLLFQSVLANLMSVYLAYILYFILRDFCIICISTYVTNATLLYLTYHKYRLLRIEADSNRGKKSS